VVKLRAPKADRKKSRPGKGARLWLWPEERNPDGTLRTKAVWIIRDGSRKISTRCPAKDRAGAKRALSEYRASKSPPGGRGCAARPADIPIVDVLATYKRYVVLHHPRANEINRYLSALKAWWADKTLADVNGPTCKAYVEQRTGQGSKSARPDTNRRPPRRISAAEARRELKGLQTAINHHHRKGFCSDRVSVVMPRGRDPPEARLPRDAEAKLLWAAWKARQVVRDSAILRSLYRSDQRGAPPRSAPDGTLTGRAANPSRIHEQVEEFCSLALTDPSLQAKLRVPDDSDRFIALVVKLARDRGFDVDARAVRASLVPGIECLTNSPISETPLPPSDWLPIRADWLGGQLHVRWSYFGKLRLREPFFEGSVHQCFLKPFNRLFGHYTPISKVADWLTAHPGMAPRGLIFHMSRCGSTLVSQMLAASDRNLVVSEASPIDAVVRAKDIRPDLADDQHAQWLTSIIAALGQPRCRERNFFVKMLSTHSLALPLFRRAFPSVPWVFLYRDPVEVLVSQLHSPSSQTITAPAGNLAGLGGKNRTKVSPESTARVLAKICTSAARHYREGGGLLVNYRELPDALWSRILPHFGVSCSKSDRAAMAAVARYDAKAPSFVFAPDVEGKQQAATSSTRAVASKHLGEVYRRLEALRQSHLGSP
jgi:hypothetical protein